MTEAIVKHQKDITALTEQVILLKQIIDGMAVELEKIEPKRSKYLKR